MTPRLRTLLVVALLATALFLGVFWLSRPRNVGAIATRGIGAALGLEIRATGATEYRLRGVPMLELRDVRVREPGARDPLLTARRIQVSLPWSSVRARGNELTAERIELDGPRIDLPALQHWLATRPPSEKRLPTISRGVRVRDGQVAGSGWKVDGIQADVPLLAARHPLRARVQGRYLDASIAVPFGLAVALTAPEALVQVGTTGFAARGTIAIEQGKTWRLPATIALSGPLHLGADGLHITPARLGIAATLESGSQRVPFALGVRGPLRYDEATWTLAPAGLALRPRTHDPRDPVPTLDAHGTLALGRRLVLWLDGAIAQWPQAWPALPAPIGTSRAPLSFALRYQGVPSLAGPASLAVQRDAARFDARFRLPAVMDWMGASTAAPLPPLDGRLVAPRLDIAGAQLEGVEMILHDDGGAIDGR